MIGIDKNLKVYIILWADSLTAVRQPEIAVNTKYNIVDSKCYFNVAYWNLQGGKL